LPLGSDFFVRGIMKNNVIEIMCALALGFATASTSAQTTPLDRHDASQEQVPQSDRVVRANQSQEQTSKWTELTETNVTVTSTPLEPNQPRNQHSEGSSADQPSKADWARCVQNDRCLPRSLFDNLWDRTFGPAHDFGN